MLEFKKFFENIDSVIAYHGTRGDFDHLEPKPARYGTGISFTKSKEVAKMYGAGAFKGGKREGEVRLITAELTGEMYDFDAPVSAGRVINGFKAMLEGYRGVFTPDKFRDLQKDIVNWSKNGESLWRGLVKSFSKKGTDRECQLAKSRNEDKKACEPVINSEQMPDLINKVLIGLGYTGITYMDSNAGISHRCYFVFNTKNVRELEYMRASA